jgi:ABC-type transport system substrate-binding protein
MSEDGLTWTVTLRDDVVFHNGEPLTAEVVKGSMERFIDPDNAFTFRSSSTASRRSRRRRAHVEFQLSSTFAPFLAHLTHNSTAIVHPDVVAEFGEDFPTRTRSARVPFSFVSWQRGERLDLVRFEATGASSPASKACAS